ncbi:hypothetical protein PAPHI01_2104 [Pancytospora philotis]|nr:hypothetical protein PAPHI01_2104 [Pancytospora philotis]
MPSVAPHINTLIIDIGTENTTVGYAGAYRPFRTERCNPGKNPAVRNSVVASIDKFLGVVGECTAREGADSLIIILHSSEEKETEEKIAAGLVARSLCSSFYFMRSAVAEVFGIGRLSAMVLSCSAGSSTISVVSDGIVVECYKEESPTLSDEEFLASGLIEDPACEDAMKGVQAQDLPKVREIRERAFLAEEPVDVSDILKRSARFSMGDAPMARYYALLDRLVAMRTAHKMVKATTNGAVLLSGGYFKNADLFARCKEYLVKQVCPGTPELVMGEDVLPAAFTGASVFGMNLESKLLFRANPNYRPLAQKQTAWSAL